MARFAKFFGALLLVIPFFSCGPGIRTDLQPLITITSPAEGATVTALSQAFTGTCTAGLPLIINYSQYVSGPTLLDCAGGTFSFTATLQAIAGTRTVSFAQVTDRGTLGITSRKIVFVHLTLSLGTGGATGPYLDPDVTVKSTNGIADSVSGGAVNSLVVDATGTLYLGGAFTSVNGTLTGQFTRLSIGSALATVVPGHSVNVVYPAPGSVGAYYVGDQSGGLSLITGSTGVNVAGYGNNTFSGALDAALNVGINAIVGADSTTNDIYVGGNFTTINAAPSSGIVRLNSSGVVQTGFSVGTGFTGGAVYALSKVSDATNPTDVYVGGAFTKYQGSNAYGLARLDNTGTMRNAFTTTAGTEIRAILPLPSGNILVAGTFGAGVYGVRELSASLAPVASGFDSRVFDKAVYTLVAGDSAYGTILVGGAFTTVDSSSSAGLARFTVTSGALDTGLAIGSGFTGGTVHGIAVATSGAIWVGGSFSAYQGLGVHGLVEIDSTGAFDSGTKVGSGFNNQVLAIAPANDGSGDVYVGGGFTYYNGVSANRLLRIGMDGTVKTSFAIGTGFNGTVRALVLAPDGSGKLYVGGDFTTYQGGAVPYVVRLKTDGTLDTAFNATAVPSPVHALANSLAANTELFVGGGTSSSGFVRTLKSTGENDFTFDQQSGFNNLVRAILPLNASTVAIGGDFTRYQTDPPDVHYLIFANVGGGGGTGGTPTTTFNNVCKTGACNLDGKVHALAVDSNSVVYIGGEFTKRITAIGPGLTASTTFLPGSGFDNTVRALALANDGSGDLLVGGDFLNYQGSAAAYYQRLTALGGVGLGAAAPDAPVYALTNALGGSGEVYLGGLFRLVNLKLTDSLSRVSQSAGGPN